MREDEITEATEAKRQKLGEWYAGFRREGRPGWSTDYDLKRKRLDRVLGKPGVPQSGRFLDMGCGAGNVTVYASQKGFDAYGIDVSPGAIAWAEQNARESGQTVDFRVGSVLDLAETYQAGFFVYDGDCLFMVVRPDPPKCLSGILQVLKPGGYFRARAHLGRPEVTERLQFKPDRYYDAETRTVVVEGVPIYQYSFRDEFVQELEDTGFAVTKEEVYVPHPDNHPVIEAFMWVDAVKPPS